VTRAILLLTLFGLIGCPSACKANRTDPAAARVESTPGQAVKPDAARPLSNHNARDQGECEPTRDCGTAERTACGCGSEPTRDTRIQEGTDPATGQPVQIVGAKLAGAPPVTVERLLAEPEVFAGKTVRLEGDISAMCHHKRRWFAVQDPGDRSGRYVRVLAAPAFLVPPHSIGKKARTEGMVEVIEVPAKTRQHLAREHDLGPAQDEPQKQVVLRASGAEII
jgi:hypothetical protein